MTGLVLLFNNCAAPHLAARLHARSCPMLRTAKRRGSVVRVEGADVAEQVEDLNERGFPVKRCKCCGGEGDASPLASTLPPPTEGDPPP